MDLTKLMEQAKKMQQDLADMENELNETVYEGASQGVIVKVNGKCEMQEIVIPEEMMNPDDREMLQDLILIAQNDAVGKAAADKEEKLGAATAGLKLPGM
ncbi:MAG: YbaB/EbfC family nucleoid-associated protein [Solobacterium sp.]|nr:YbaB/EbfC family nucleoid-associated protein [Solobacterium sp.]